MVGFQPFVSPYYYHWSLSGEFVIMEILGGMGTLVGPLIGTAIIVFMEDIASTWFKEAWMLCLGAVYVLCVLFSPEGVAGIIKNISVMGFFTKFFRRFTKDVYLRKN
jgi:branched-chain amino acid transport system permease protein